MCSSDLKRLELGALLHDIGKIGIPESILTKPGRLTAGERRVMESHPALGEQIIAPIDRLQDVRPIVRHCHERWDGRGYPQGLGGQDIPWAARVISVADTLDALTSARPYRDAISFEAAAVEIMRCSETQFDPDVAKAAAKIDPDEWGLIREQAESTDPTFDSLVAGYL